EALAGLPAELPRPQHAHEPRRRRQARLAELLVQRLARVDMDIRADEIEQRTRTHRPSRAVPQPRVEIFRRHAGLIEDAYAVVEQRDEDAVDDEAGRVAAADRRLAETGAELERRLEDGVARPFRAHDLDER